MSKYVIEKVLVEGWKHEFLKIVDTKDQIKKFTTRLRGYKLSIVEIKTEKDSRDYFINAVKGLDSDLSPENLYCDGEVSLAEAAVEERNILSKLAKMERESGMNLKQYMWEL